MISRVLVTGAAGFLGRAISVRLAGEYRVRLFDVEPGPCPAGAEWFAGDVSSPEAVRRACAGVDAVVIAHMAPNRPGVYDSPPVPFSVNVTGTALVFAEAAAAGAKRVVLISTAGVVHAALKAGTFLTPELPPSPLILYGLTKALQEQVASYYSRTAGLPVAVLRPSAIIDEETLTDKYGKRWPAANWQMIDPRDIATAASAALRLPDLGFEVFHLFGHPSADSHADAARARERLGWKPRHDFSRWPQEP